MNFSLLVKATQALREKRLGDAAAYKAAALTAAPYADVKQAVSKLAEPLPDFPTRLAASTIPGSLGDAYATFVTRHSITPLRISSEVRRELESHNLVAVRYTLVHDIFHVLLNFDISRPGELAVWSFVAAQRYSPSYKAAATLARVLYPIAQPTAFSELRRQRARAIELAGQSPCLIGKPLEQYWSQELNDVRVQLGLPAYQATRVTARASASPPS